MNYAQYLEDGNKVANPSVEKQVESLVQSARQELEAGLPGEACNAIKQAWQDEEQKQILTQVADSNPQLGELLSGIISTLMPGSLKCGGKVRAKVKKASCGKKMEKGGQTLVKKEAKGGCPCKRLMRVGGKLIEVDCNNIPIAKNGMVMKFLNPPQPLQMTGYHAYTPELLKAQGAVMDSKGNNKWFYLNPEDNTLYKNFTPRIGGDGVTNNWSKANDEDIARYHLLLGHGKTTAGYFENVKGGGRRYLTGDWAGYTFMKGKDGKLYGNYGDKDAKWDANNGVWAKEGFTYGKSGWEPIVEEESNTNDTPTKTPGQLMFERGLAPNILSDYSLQGRLNWVNSAENRAYLDANGWDEKRRAAYKGSAADNRELLKLIQGRAGWNQEQEELQRRQQEAAVFGNNMTNRQLLEYDPTASGAQQLGADAATRRQKLLDAQAARNKALTFNGKQYADELAYNKAVGSANLAAANKYYQDMEAANQDYNNRRAQAIGYSGSNKNILARRNAAFDNIAKWQAGNLDLSTLSLKERNDVARQMRRAGDKSLYIMPQYGQAPTVIGNYSGPAALTEELLNATAFKNGGSLINYAQYLNLK